MDADVVIIGIGPAGLQAAIHSARRRVSTVAVGKRSGSAVDGARVENYMGVPSVDGTALVDAGIAQARSFGCTVIEENVLSVSGSSGSFSVDLEGGETVSAKAVILATGISRVKLGVPGEKDLFGKGVSYCASCDCNFYRGRKVAVIGDDTEAAVSAELLTRYASEVYWITPSTRASGRVVDAAVAAGVSVLKSPAAAIRGTDSVESLVLEDGTSLAVDGVFIELGAKSAADLAMDLGVMPETDDTIKVDASCSTGVSGVFACGDVTGKPWQVAKAVGQGCVAGTAAAEYVKGGAS